MSGTEIALVAAVIWASYATYKAIMYKLVLKAIEYTAKMYPEEWARFTAECAYRNNAT
jgi:hypothetical protein